MARLDIAEIVHRGVLACPDCRTPFLEGEGVEGRIRCGSCRESYPILDGCPLLLPPASCTDPTKQRIQTFWKDLYTEAYARNDAKTSKKELSQWLPELEQLFRHRTHLAVEEMPVMELAGKKVLEIGSGAGAHSALFSSKGAEMVSLDLTLDRVAATARKLDGLNAHKKDFCVQGDAERLPFADHSFDIVYSNGVLHHTPDTERTIREVYRVLKPGGRAVIMLYSKNSWLYWVNLFFIKGLLLGRAFRHRNWLGRSTEWMSNRPQQALNPETKVYSKKKILRLFAPFREVSVRKNSFVTQQIPLLGKPFSRLLGKITGYNQAGVLLYGHPWRNETCWEIWLGKYMGFAWNILASKS